MNLVEPPGWAGPRINKVTNRRRRANQTDREQTPVFGRPMQIDQSSKRPIVPKRTRRSTHRPNEDRIPTMPRGFFDQGQLRGERTGATEHITCRVTSQRGPCRRRDFAGPFCHPDPPPNFCRLARVSCLRSFSTCIDPLGSVMDDKLRRYSHLRPQDQAERASDVTGEHR
jgi:hypothetical protein